MDFNYTTMLMMNMFEAKYALLHALETLDKMRYSEAPDLQARYMLSVGTFEQTVLEAELDAIMAQRKAELIQICRNQRKAVNIEEIDAIVANEREEKLQAIERKDADARSVLSEEDVRELDQLYHNIVKCFHPAVHKDLSALEQELYQKAMVAYQNQDLRSLNLISGMLFAFGDETSSVSTSYVEPDEKRDSGNLNDMVFSDYSLAEKLYLYFSPTEEDLQLNALISDYTKKQEEILSEIEMLKNEFPFTVEEILRNPAKMSEYTEQLKLRLAQAQMTLREQEEKIRKLTEEYTHG